MRNNFIVLLTLMIICNTKTYIYAEQIPNNVVQFGRIEGMEADYYFYIPISWKDYITVERNTNLKNGAIENLNFYYNPNDKSQSSYLFYSMYIFETKNYNPSKSFNFVIEDNGYTFVSEEFLDYNSTNYIDSIIFSRFTSELSNRDFITNKVDITAKNTSNGQYNNVYVNDNKLKNTSFVSSNDITYLPIREICELLNFDVNWSNANKSIIIKNNDITDVIYLRSKNTYTPVVIDGNVYMPSMYFVNFLGLNVNIDSKSNVRVYG